MKIRWKNSIFLSLFLMFLLVITPLFGIGINIYNWGAHSIKAEINKSMIAQAGFYMNGLETEIQRMRMLEYDLISDEDLNGLAFVDKSMNSFEKTQAMLRLQRRLNTVKSSSRYIDDVTISIRGLNTTISANTGVNKGIAIDAGAGVNANAFLSPESQIVYRDGSFRIYVLYPIVNRSAGKFPYVIEIRLLESAFLNDLKQFNTYAGNVSILTDRKKVFLNDGDPDRDSEEIMVDSLTREMNRSLTGTFYEKVKGEKRLAIYSTSEYLGLSLIRYVPDRSVFSLLDRYQGLLWIFATVSFFIVALFSVSIYNVIHKPIHRMMRAFRKVENGDMTVHLEHRGNNEFRQLYQNFNRMVENLGTLIDQAYKQKILMQNAELKQLQAQINPHFLYNTFFILYSLAKAEDNENVISFLKQLGNYFKYITRNGEDVVPLYKEIDHARTYSNIQELRFFKRVSIDFEDLPPKFGALSVPRLIIQPIIENSFKYGLEDKESEGILRITFRESDGFLGIVVEDNGNGLNNADMIGLRNTLDKPTYEGEVTGILNIHRRLQLMYGKNSGVFIEHSGLGGLKVTMKLELEGFGNV